MTRYRFIAVTLGLCASLALGCDAGGDLDYQPLPATADNGLSLNALSLNALSLNALSLNALSLNALSLNSLEPGSSELSPEGLRAIEASPDAALILGYVARCALAQGTELVATIEGEVHRFPGMFGFASAWLRAPLGEREQRWMSGCLVAHANHYGVPVPISVRAEGAESTPGEWAEFGLYEASFYGNLFGPSPLVFACQGTEPSEALAASSDRELRVCSDPANGIAGETVCSIPALPIVNPAGACEALCARSSSITGFTDCEGTSEVVSVWLREDADPTERPGSR